METICTYLIDHLLFLTTFSKTVPNRTTSLTHKHEPDRQVHQLVVSIHMIPDVLELVPDAPNVEHHSKVTAIATTSEGAEW